MTRNPDTGRMVTEATVDRLVRISVTPEQYRRIKILAIERQQEIRALVTAALQTSPITEKVFW